MAPSKTPRTEDPKTNQTRPGDAKLAFERLEPEIRARAEQADLTLPRIDPNRASALALGSAARLAPFREQIEATCKATDVRLLDGLRDMALAAWYASLLPDEGPDMPRRVPALIEEARPLREKLLRAAELLAQFGMMPEARTERIRSGLGHHDLAADLVQLARLFDEAWPEVEQRSPVTREMVDRACGLGADLQAALGTEDAARQRNPVGQLRAAALSLLLERYEELRRAISYLRWHEGDADEIAPSLYTARRRPRASRPDDPAPDPSPPDTEPVLVPE